MKDYKQVDVFSKNKLDLSNCSKKIIAKQLFFAKAYDFFIKLVFYL